jgi:hypothetical protein
MPDFDTPSFFVSTRAMCLLYDSETMTCLSLSYKE